MKFVAGRNALIQLTERVFVHELPTKRSWILWHWPPKIGFLWAHHQLKIQQHERKHLKNAHKMKVNTKSTVENGNIKASYTFT